MNTKIISSVIGQLLYLFYMHDMCSSRDNGVGGMHRRKLGSIANEKRPFLPHVQPVGFQRPINDISIVTEHALGKPCGCVGGVELVRMLPD